MHWKPPVASGKERRVGSMGSPPRPPLPRKRPSLQPTMNTPNRPQLFGLFAGLFLAAALCFSSILGTRAWVHLKESQLVRVTGSARKDVRSDLVVWTAMLQTDGASLDHARRQFGADLEAVRSFLSDRDVAEVAMSPIKVIALRASSKAEADDNRPSVAAGFRLTQELRVTSTDVERIPQVAADSLSLIGEGVVFETLGLEFIYTRAGEAKVAMMAEATADARVRAERIAGQGGRQIGELRSAKAGVFQINPLHSTETSWDGLNDKSSLLKTMTVTVAAEFVLQ